MLEQIVRRPFETPQKTEIDFEDHCEIRTLVEHSARSFENVAFETLDVDLEDVDRPRDVVVETDDIHFIRAEK